MRRTLTWSARFFLTAILSLCLSSVAQASGPSGGAHAGVASISGGAALVAGSAAATGIGAPVGGAIALGTGAFQIGWGIGTLFCELFDPPDTANACVPVVLSSFLIPFPDLQVIEPSVPGPLAAAFDASIDQVDIMLALSRAGQAAFDRHAGAVILDTAICAADRLAELEAFRNQMGTAALSAQSALTSIFNEIDAIDPALLVVPVSQNDVRVIRDDTISGSFPPFEMLAISVWEITPSELAAFQGRMSALSDTDIDDFFMTIDAPGDDITIRESIEVGIAANVNDECFEAAFLGSPAIVVPALSEGNTVLLALGLVASGGLLLVIRRRQLAVGE